MLCCVAAVAVLAWLRRVWHLLTLRGDAGDRTTLPPQVYRPAPGSTATPEQPKVQARPVAVRRGGRKRLAQTLVVGGAAWLLGTEVAMHGFGLFAFVHDSELLHVLFHGSGPVLMLLGLAVYPAVLGTRQLRWHS